MNRISDIRKVMVNSGERVEPYSLEDTISYYETEIIANRCSDYKGLLESVLMRLHMSAKFLEPVSSVECFPIQLQHYL